jgi:hypothetical protein
MFIAERELHPFTLPNGDCIPTGKQKIIKLQTRRKAQKKAYAFHGGTQHGLDH